MTDSTEEPKKTVDSDDDSGLKIVETPEPKAPDPPPLSPADSSVKKEELKPSNQDEEEKAPILKAEEPSKPQQILHAVETAQSKATSLPMSSAPTSSTPTSSTSTTSGAPVTSTQKKPRPKSKKTTKKTENPIALTSSFTPPMFQQAFNQNGNTFYTYPMIRSANNTGVSTAIRYQPPGGGSFFFVQNPTSSQQSTPIIVSQQHQLPSTSTVTVQSKPKTNSNGNANWKTQNSNPYFIKPPIVSTSVASSTSSSLPNGEFPQRFLIPCNPPHQHLFLARNADGTQQLMQIAAWSKGPSASDCPPPPTLSPNPSTSTAKPQKKLPKLTPEAPPADPQVKLNGSTDEAMESAEDDQPPQIDREDDGNERNPDQRNSTAQKTKIAFADAAHVHHQRNGSTPQILKHYVDGQVVEEDISSLSSPPTKQRKLAQPPFSIPVDESAIRQIAQHQVKWVSTPKNGSTTSNGTAKQNRAIYVQQQTPPVIRPANYQPEPKKEAPPSPKQDSKSLVGRSPAITKPPVTTSSSEPVTGGSHRKRNRPTKPETETPHRFSSTDDAASSKRVKSAGSTPTENVSGKTRKNREVEGLLNMDFGPGKTPFQTTNPQLFTENVLTSRERIQSHVGNDDGRTSRASETSQRADRRRQNSVLSSSGRPRRFAQSNVAYSKMLDGGLESEDDYKQEEDDNSRMLNNHCIICGKSPTNPSFPQYCDKNCQMTFKKRQRMELMTQHLTNSTESTIKKSPKIPTPQPLNSSAGELDSLRSIGIQNWTASQTARWAELVSGSTEVGQKFLEQEIDGAALLFLDESQLKSELGLKLGPMIKIVRDLNELKKNEATR
ncbi:Polyhomeotic distal [Aphelenchoides besseyi]|nr:Polyhomeotic distal [Aphelenchoides besseyi]